MSIKTDMVGPCHHFDDTTILVKPSMSIRRYGWAEPTGYNQPSGVEGDSQRLSKENLCTRLCSKWDYVTMYRKCCSTQPTSQV